MNEETATTATTTETEAEGFRISDDPIVRTEAAMTERQDELPASYDHDLLYLTARDPHSLFLYWDVNWTRLFERAKLSARQVHLRTYRDDGSIEKTTELNPFREHCFVEVAQAGARHHCELGCFVGEDWVALLRSGAATTPQDKVSDNLEAKFATLPLHLSFQRMLELFQQQATPATLAESVGQLQDEARQLRREMPADDWERLLAQADPRAHEDSSSSDFSTLIKAALENEKPAPPTPEQLAHWQKLAERLGGASWAGASEFA